MNLINEQEVVAEMKRLLEIGDYVALNKLGVDHACAKQAAELKNAEAAYLASLSGVDLARAMRQPVCVNSGRF